MLFPPPMNSQERLYSGKKNKQMVSINSQSKFYLNVTSLHFQYDTPDLLEILLIERFMSKIKISTHRSLRKRLFNIYIGCNVRMVLPTS